MKKLKSAFAPIFTFVIGTMVGAIGYSFYIEKININYDRITTELHYESSLCLFWALATEKTELAKNLVAQDIRIIQGKMTKNKDTVTIPHNLDSLLKNSLDYKYVGTVFSTLPIQTHNTGSVCK